MWQRLVSGFVCSQSWKQGFNHISHTPTLGFWWCRSQVGSMGGTGPVPRHAVVFALLNTDYDTLNEKSIKLVYKPLPQYLCFHVASLPTHWNFRLPRCRCNFMWSSFLCYHDLSLKNDPDAVRHLKPPILLWKLDWSHKTDTEHDPWLLW